MAKIIENATLQKRMSKSGNVISLLPSNLFENQKGSKQNNPE
mgnify:FL=1|jgi:hypothetical protein